MSWALRVISKSKESLISYVEHQHQQSIVGSYATFPREVADAVKAALIAFPTIHGYFDLETFGHVDTSGVGNITIRIQTLEPGIIL